MTDSVQVFSLQTIASHIGGEVSGDPESQVTGLATLATANASQLSFLSNSKYVKDLGATQAAAVILSTEQAKDFSGNAIIHKNPYVGFALASQLLDSTPHQAATISQSAEIDSSASVANNVGIGAGAVISKNVTIGEGARIGPGVFVGEGTIIGKHCNIRANVTLYHGVTLGDRVSIHSGTVIGADGFGYANDKGRWIKIPQTGGVRIGDDTEIGANTCIDRGALDDTVVGINCIIDNFVQIAHNCIIGDYSCICGNTGMAGSVNIGKYVVIAGSCAINGHISICDKVQITGFTMVTKSITEPGVYSSGAPAAPTREWQKNAVQLRSIDKLYKRVKMLEDRQK